MQNNDFHFFSDQPEVFHYQVLSGFPLLSSKDTLMARDFALRHLNTSPASRVKTRDALCHPFVNKSDGFNVELEDFWARGP